MHGPACTKATKSPQDPEERGAGGKNNLEINLPTSKPTNTDAMCAGASAAVVGKITGATNCLQKCFLHGISPFAPQTRLKQDGGEGGWRLN